MQATTKEDVTVTIPKGAMEALLGKHSAWKGTKRVWTQVTTACADFRVLAGMGMSLAAFLYHWGDAAALFDCIKAIPQDGNYVFNASVYVVDKYHNGHVTIEKERFGTAGFVNGNYLYMPMIWDTHWASMVEPPSGLFVQRCGPDVEATLAASTRLANYHYIHADGLSDSDLLTLLFAYHPSPTTTPFLVDMDVHLPVNAKRLRINRPGCPWWETEGSVTARLQSHRPTAADYLRILLSLVQLNRWEEALFEAERYIAPFISQPEPDTIEAHTWIKYTRDLYLPKLGLARGIHLVSVLG